MNKIMTAHLLKALQLQQAENLKQIEYYEKQLLEDRYDDRGEAENSLGYHQGVSQTLLNVISLIKDI